MLTNRIFIIVFMISLLERLIKFWLVIHFFKKTVTTTEKSPSISILQPILSGDPTLWRCLAANLKMKSRHRVEYIWLVDDNDPEAIEGCQKLIERFPEKIIRLAVFPPPPSNVNPKTFKLLKGLQLAENESIAILDDDTMLPDFGLDKTVKFSQKGVVFGLPYYVNFSNIWSGLVSCFVNSQSLFTYIPYTFVSKPITLNGIFYMLPKAVFQEVTQNSDFENALTDDYAIAQLAKQKGYELIQTTVCHGISTQVTDFQHYIRLLKRWFVFPQVSLMKSRNLKELTVFLGFVLLPVLFPLALVIFMVFNFNFITACLTATYLFANLNFLIAFNGYYFKNATPVRFYWALALQPVLVPFYMLGAIISPKRINWRGHTMQVNKDGKFNFISRRK